MAFKGQKRMTADEQRNMNTLFDLIQRTNKRMPVAKDEGALNNSTYEQNCNAVKEHWRKVNLRNSGKSVSINLPAGEVGNGVGQGATDLTLEEQFAKHEGKPVGKDSFTQRNAIAARKNSVTMHQLEPAEIVHKNIGAAQKAYQAIMDEL